MTDIRKEAESRAKQILVNGLRSHWKRINLGKHGEGTEIKTDYGDVTNEIADQIEPLLGRIAELTKAEKELSDAYLRIRELVGAWDTNHGGENRFEVTENKIKELEAENIRLKNRVCVKIHPREKELESLVGKLGQAFKEIIGVLGPDIPECCKGGKAEMQMSLDEAKEALALIPKGLRKP